MQRQAALLYDYLEFNFSSQSKFDFKFDIWNKKIYISMYKNLFVAGCPTGQFPGNQFVIGADP